MFADWILFGGKIRAFDDSKESATAIAVADGRILATGNDDIISAFAGPGTIHTDLNGATLMPGFGDTHMHFEKVSHDLQMVHLDQARSFEDIFALIRQKAARRPKGSWIRSFGDTALWHEKFLVEQRLPTGDELSAVAPDHPVYLYRRPLRAVLNATAVEVLCDQLKALSPEEWDPVTGVLAGPVVRKINDQLYKLASTDFENRLHILKEASEILLSMGITTIVDPGLAAGFNAGWELYNEAITRGSLHQRMRLMNRIDYRRPLPEEVERIVTGLAMPGEGDDRLRAWSLKLFMDGEFDDALMRPGQELVTPGVRRYLPDELLSIVRMCGENRWALCVHVMGGGAIRAVIEAVEACLADGLSFAAGQISMCHAFLMDDADMRDCNRLDIGISVQPLLAYVFVEEMRRHWGPLSDQSNRIRSMREHGVNVAGGSDTLPCPPLLGASIAVNRRAHDGSSLGEDEAVAPDVALELFTRCLGTYLGEPELGSLKVGSHADFAVWPDDPLDHDSATWRQLKPSLVAIAGRQVWTA